MADKNIAIALILSAVDKASAVVAKTFRNAEKHAKSLESASKTFNEVGDKALIAGGAITAFFAKNIADARESAKAQAMLIKGFETMGGTAKQAQEAMDFAGEMQFKWGIEDEQIMKVEGKLSTFSRTLTDVAKQNDIFNRATQAAFDMQAKGFGDAEGNITQLAKALQNPALGATALAKAGAVNKEDLPVIKYIQATKGLGEAQLYIMKAVEKQVKGSAEAMADPLDKMKIEYSEVSESLGMTLLPMVTKLARKIGEYAPKIIAWVNAHKPLITIVAKAGIALLGFGIVMRGVGFVLGGFSTALNVASGISKLAKALNSAGVVAGVASKGLKMFQFASFAMQYHLKFSVIPALKSAGASIIQFGVTMKTQMMSSVIPAIKSASISIVKFGITLLASPITWYIMAAVALGAAVYFIIRNWDKVSAFFKRLWGGIKQVFMMFWNWAKWYFLNLTPYGLIIKHWDKISHMFILVWDKVKKVFTGTWEWIKSLGRKFWDAGKNIAISIGKGIWAAATYPVKAISEIAKKVRAFLPFSPAKEGALRDIHKIKLVETIAQTIKPKPLVDAMDNTTSQLYNHIQGSRPKGAGGALIGGGFEFNLTINLSGSASKQDADMLSDTVKSQLEKWWRQKEQNQARVAF